MSLVTFVCLAALYCVVPIDAFLRHPYLGGEEPRYCNELLTMTKSTHDSARSPYSKLNIECEQDGRFKPLQCDNEGNCGCVNAFGNLLARTLTSANRGPPVCKDLKPGQCPVNTVVDSCDMTCTTDSDCRMHFKCCDTDCGRVCIEPTHECISNEYTCIDRLTCVPEDYICDGVPDCLDGDDEAICPHPRFQCPFDRKIPMEKRCDSFLDCPDGSDETGCIVDYFTVSPLSETRNISNWRLSDVIGGGARQHITFQASPSKQLVRQVP
ncbi:sortilin-related receptor-like [Ptychodera flava]|uniref:sortilin-related receptor-like n=1 Tax=Ptychodera flava TaxID=63121 RepID=UPI00396AB007